MNDKPTLEDWSAFAGSFLKVDLVKEFPFKCVCKDIGSEFNQDGKPKFWIVTEYQNKTFKIGLNATNLKIVQQSKYLPKELIGKIFIFDKIKVRNPATNAMVDSFLISKIEAVK
jgi:hypothetical protein